jgi:hypothetical protein
MRLIKPARNVETKVMESGKWADLAPICGVLAVLTAGPAFTAEPPSRAPAMQSVLNCRAIQDGVQRLACFDKAVGDMAKAEDTGDLVTIDREQRRTVRRKAFGLTLPSLAMFDKGEKADEANHIAVTLNGAARNGSGKWVLTLDDGAVWRQIDDGDLEPPPRAGEKAVIRRAALGSYMMHIEGSAIRVHRDN